MPIYEYKCSSCEAVFEVLQRVSEPPLKKCIKCGGSVQKLISAPAIQFKGTGWYITDYANKNKGPQESKTSTKEPPKEEKKSTPEKSKSAAKD